MTVVRSGPDCTSADLVVEGAIRAWNSGSATEFAGYFTENADLVNVHGMHVRGRQAIAGLYDMLFRTVFARGSLEASVTSRRKIRGDVELIHLRVKGNLSRVRQGEQQNVIVSLIMTDHGNCWAITAMHNTLVS